MLAIIRETLVSRSILNHIVVHSIIVQNARCIFVLAIASINFTRVDYLHYIPF